MLKRDKSCINGSKKGKNDADVNLQSIFGGTALIMASNREYNDIAKYLKNQGATE